ncbi:MAG TPA: polysaccharide deacetylase family protein [Chloroflexia bacterium]|nr:polysaccharide deacetylase family protein [Chloroflexia bacterium]
MLVTTLEGSLEGRSEGTQLQKIPILLYHSISEEASPEFKLYTVTPAMFERQLAYLSGQHYSPLTVTELVTALRTGGSTLPEKPVIITFDDGFQDFYTAALPALTRYGFTATLYVTTGLIEKTSKWLASEGEGTRRMLNWSQLYEIDASGIELGGHTLNHPQLDLLPASMARNEIELCKKTLEHKLGYPVLSFAYPHGYHTSTIKRMVREAGFTSACAVKFAMSSVNDDPFALSRLLVTNDTDEEAFEALLSSQNSTVKMAAKKALAPAWRMWRRYKTQA